jgi:hypothetical protein
MMRDKTNIRLLIRMRVKKTLEDEERQVWAIVIQWVRSVVCVSHALRAKTPRLVE